jgi:membrane protein
MVDRLKGLLSDLDAWSMRHSTTRISRRAVTGFLNHEALQYAGSMAYFAVLSVFQLLVLGVVIGSFFLGEGSAREFVVEQVDAGSPLDAETITGVIDAVIESRGSIGVITGGFLLWAALGIFSALSNGINRVFEHAPKRPFLKDKLIGLMLMGLTGGLALGSLVIGIVTGILQQVADEVTFGEVGETIVWLTGLLAPIILIFLAFWVIYRVVPNRPVGWMEVLPGALVATVLWTALRFGFTWYATDVANYDSTFGPISTGVTLLVFLYFASVIVLLGAEFARASALDDDWEQIHAANPAFLPVPVDPVPASPPPARRGVPKPVVAAGAAALGVLIGRLTKRDDEDL